MNGETFGKYEIRGTLGAGAMGVVHDAFDPVIERRAALKIFRRPSAGDAEGAEAMARFKREAQAAGRLSHPNIVAVFDYGEDDKHAWIAMELVEGGTLKDLLDRGERLPLPRIVALMSEVLAALDYSHKRGVVHRDIKPANIMLDQEDRVKIADFGIARIENSSMTQVGTVMGTPSYMAPEQLRGETVDSRADIWAAGVVLYQLLTGAKPFPGGYAQLQHTAIHTEPAPPSALSVTTPVAFDALIARALAKRPDGRFATAGEFAAALRTAATLGMPPADPDATVVAGGTTIAPKPMTPPPPSAVPPALAAGKRPPVALMGGAVALLVAVGAGFMLLGGGGTPAPTVVAVAPPAAGPVLQPSPGPAVLPPTLAPAQPLPVPAPAAPTQPAALAPAPIPATTPSQIPATTPMQVPLPAAPTITTNPPAAGPVALPPTLPPASPGPVAGPQPTGQTPRPAPPGVEKPGTMAPPQLALAQPPRPDFRAAAAALSAAPGCGLFNASATDSTLALEGVLRRGDEAALRRSLTARYIPGSAAQLALQLFDGNYCAALDALRPVLADTGQAPRIGVVGTMPLLANQLLRFDVSIPEWPAYLTVAYFMQSGEVAHLVPSAPQAAGGTVRLGEPRAGFPGWEVSEPFGTDLLVALVSEGPLFTTPRPEVEPQASYIAALSQALALARQAGRRVQVRPVVVATAAR